MEVIYEGKGPHGVLVIVECATDNITRTVANIRSYFTRAEGGFVPAGSLDYMFSRKAIFEFDLPEGMEMDELELELIDAGIDELEEIDGKMVAYAAYSLYGSLSKKLDELGITVDKATLVRIPNNPINFTEEHFVDIDKMLDKIEDDDDVQNVFTNIN